MAHGTGYFSPSASEIHTMMIHRRRQLLALSMKARRDDEIERELRDLESDIESGVAALEALEAEKRQEMAEKLYQRISRARVWNELRMLRAKDIMSPDVVTMNEEDALFQVAEAVRRTGHRSFPVVNGNKVVGLITLREVVRASVARSTPDQGDFVAALMREPRCVGPETTVGEVGRLLRGHDAPCVLVTEGGLLKGIVTKDDILGLLVSEFDRIPSE